jgi:glucose/mannose-6-phosphate isomerase
MANMIDLNDLDKIKELDPRDTLGSTDLMLKQCEGAWDEVNALNLPHHIEGIQNIVYCGMGASIYGALVLKGLLGRENPYPSEAIADYFLPDYVNDKTLVVLTSYSGTTEEVLSCAHEAKAKGAKMIVLTKGGPLAEFAKENDLPAYIFDGKLNLSGAPRVGCGYSIYGLMGLLDKLNIIDMRVDLSIEIVNKNNYPVHTFLTTGASVYDDFLETLIYGAFFTTYLGLLYGQNPAVNPYVDWFKEQLAK